jgi:hypothetical protein
MSQTPFWERNLFWGTASFSVTFALSGLAFAINGETVVSAYLFIAAWPCAVMASWCVTTKIENRSARFSLWFVLVLAVTTALIVSDKWLETRNETAMADYVNHPIAPPRPPDGAYQNGVKAQPPKAAPEKSPADLSFFFFSENGQPRFSIVNTGDESAQEPKWTMALVDLSNEYYPHYKSDPESSEPLPIPTQKIDDFVKRHTSLGNFEIFNEATSNHVKTGDRIFGLAGITCSNCPADRKMWLYWEVGAGGWYASFSPLKPDEKLFKQPNMSNVEIDDLLSRAVPLGERIPINEGQAPGFDLTRP